MDAYAQTRDWRATRRHAHHPNERTSRWDASDRAKEERAFSLLKADFEPAYDGVPISRLAPVLDFITINQHLRSLALLFIFITFVFVTASGGILILDLHTRVERADGVGTHIGLVGRS